MNARVVLLIPETPVLPWVTPLIGGVVTRVRVLVGVRPLGLQNTLVMVSGFAPGFWESWVASGQPGAIKMNDILVKIDDTVRNLCLFLTQRG